MGWFDWLFEQKTEGPPEPLVLGARLHCTYGSQESYLWVDAKNFDINHVPQACVEDCVALHHILPFGDCYASGGPCERCMEIHGPWENPEPQGMKVNGNEVITTKSVLMCRKSAGPFEIRSSGQDHKFAEQILFMKEMEAKHPGLRAILDSPDGSLYLSEGMYRTAIEFLESRMKANGGGIDLCIIEDKDSVEGCYIKSALAHLEPGFNMESIGTFCDGIENAASRYGATGQEGIDEHVLNGAMLDLLKRDSEEMDRRIKAGGFYRWQEEHKRGLRLASDWMIGSEFSVLMAASVMVSPVNVGSEEKEDYEGGSGAKYNQQILDEIEKYKDFYRKDLDYYDCSEIADDLFKASGEKGTIYAISPNKKHNLVVSEYGKNVTYEYHTVYSDGKYIYDPRYSETPMLESEYFDIIKNLNPDGITINIE